MASLTFGGGLGMREFQWRDGVVRWRIDGEGPPVVFCHGTPWSSWLWNGVADVLASAFTVFRWDMLGYGTSDMAEGQDVSLGAQAELFAALLDYWNLDSPAVIAHDYGGAVALRAHLLHGRAFRSLALVDVVALAPWGSPFFSLVHDHAQVFEQLPENLHEALVRAYIQSASHRGLDDEQLDYLMAPWRGSAGQAAFYRQIAQADQRFTDEIEPLYGRVDVPVKIVWGTEDTWIPVDRAHRLHGQIPGSSLELLSGAGHLVQLDRGDALTAALDSWLRHET